jgi:hypothetical protein
MPRGIEVVSNNEIIRFWGYENLRRWPERNVRDLKIADSSKTFLIEVGLPSKEQTWTMLFDGETDTFPRLPGKPDYRTVGYDYIVPICLDESRGGIVLADEAVVNGPETFVNSSVELFGEFLVYYQQYRYTAKALSEEEVETLISRIEETMRERDGKALSSPEDWWPGILEQMKDGFL